MLLSLIGSRQQRSAKLALAQSEAACCPSAQAKLTGWCGCTLASRLTEFRRAGLQGTQADFKNELLFSQFGINYNNLPEQYRKVGKEHIYFTPVFLVSCLIAGCCLLCILHNA